MNRILGAGLVILCVVFAPQILNGASFIANNLAGMIEGTAQAGTPINPVQPTPMQPNTGVLVDINSNANTYQQPFNFSFNYSDSENSINVVGNERQAELHANTSGGTWETIKLNIVNFLRNLGVYVQVTNRGRQ
jgi:hypothetical protein